MLYKHFGFCFFCSMQLIIPSITAMKRDAEQQIGEEPAAKKCRIQASTESTEQETEISALSEHVITEILSNLNYSDLNDASLTCKFWNKIAKQQLVEYRRQAHVIVMDYVKKYYPEQFKNEEMFDNEEDAKYFAQLQEDLEKKLDDVHPAVAEYVEAEIADLYEKNGGIRRWILRNYLDENHPILKEVFYLLRNFDTAYQAHTTFESRSGFHFVLRLYNFTILNTRWLTPNKVNDIGKNYAFAHFEKTKCGNSLYLAKALDAMLKQDNPLAKEFIEMQKLHQQKLEELKLLLARNSFLREQFAAIYVRTFPVLLRIKIKEQLQFLLKYYQKSIPLLQNVIAGLKSSENLEENMDTLRNFEDLLP